MEEAYEILNYLPIHFKQPSEQEYIQFLVKYNANEIEGYTFKLES